MCELGSQVCIILVMCVITTQSLHPCGMTYCEYFGKKCIISIHWLTSLHMKRKYSDSSL